MRSVLVNYLLYQVGWCACVFGAAFGHALAGIAIASLALAAHIAMAERRRDEVQLALVAAVIGIVVDTIQMRLGTLAFRPTGSLHASLSPVWMWLLWAQFATTLHFSMAWLRQGPARATLFGAVGGPVAFLAGARLGAVTFGAPRWMALLVLGCLWSVAVPVLASAARRQPSRSGAQVYLWDR